MKTRFSTADIIVVIKELKRFLGMRVSNVYDIDNKTYLIRLQKPDEKAIILLESGIRLHSTEFDWPKNPAPSGFSMKMRKHLKGRRLESIEQLGVDRIVDIQFGSSEAAYHVILELYDRGNIILTDYEYTILNILRPRTDNSQDVRFAVRETYPLDVAKQHEVPTEEKVLQIISSGKEGDPLKKLLIPNLDYGPALLDHCLLEVGFSENVKLGKGFNITEDMSKLLLAIEEAEKLFEKLQSEKTKGFIIQKKDKRPVKKDDEEQEIITYEEFHPILLRQHENKLFSEFNSFDSAVDEFFSKLESQKLDLKTVQQEKSALKKLDNVRKDHEKRINELQKEQESDILRGQLIEMNLPLVDEALFRVRSALANQIDWTEIWKLIKESQLLQDPVACAIKSVRLDTNHIALLLSDPYEDGINEDDVYQPLKAMKIDVDLSLSAYANSRKYFDKKKQAAKKEQKTLDASTKAFKSAEKKTKQTLKDVATVASINKTRKAFWFEKFLWFISSENYLVIGGRDQQQNELIVKRYLKPGDLYVHADLHGASSCIIKNPSGEPVPPKTLNEAGTMAICNSAAWDAKVVTSAWYVYHDQVSKTAPSGEYLTTGSFMVRGKKNYLPPSYLIYGFAYVFKLEEGSIPHHKGERKVRTIEDDEISVTNSVSVESGITEDTAEVTDKKNDGDDDSNSESETEEKCDTEDDTNSDSDDLASKSEDEKPSMTKEVSKTIEKSSDLVRTSSTSEGSFAKDNSVIDSSLVKKKPSSKSSGKKTVAVKKEDSDAGSAKMNNDSEAESDSEKNTSAFPDTSINLLHVKGDKFELQRTISTSSTTSGISEGENRVIFLGDDQPVTIGEKCVNTGAKLSAKQRRELRKARKDPTSSLQVDNEEDKVSWLKQELSPTSKDENKEKQKKESTKPENPAPQQQAPPKRGQKGKLKKIKDKYKDQDEEERQLRMEILASAGTEKEAKNKKGKKGKNAQKFVSGNNKQQGAKGDEKNKQGSEKTEGNKIKQTGPVELSSIIQQTAEISVEEDEKMKMTPKDAKKTTKPEAADSDDEKTEGNTPQTDDTDILDSLTGCPIADDELLYAVPMCAPYSCLINYKYKVKLLPGNTKRGKAAKMAINMFLHEKSSTSREKDLLRVMKDIDVSRNIPGKVKLAAPNLRKAKK